MFYRLGVVFLSFITICELSAAQNLVRNGDFRKDGDWCESVCCSCFKMSFRKTAGQSRVMIISDRKQNWAGPGQTLPTDLAGKKLKLSYKVRLPCGYKTPVRIYMTFRWNLNNVKKFLKPAFVSAAPCEWRTANELFDMPNTVASPVNIYFETASTGGVIPDFELQDVSINEYKESSDWSARADRLIDQYRKKDVTIRITNVPDTLALKGSIKLVNHGFKMGSAIRDLIVHNPQYRKVFQENFDMAVIENSLKWRQTEFKRYALRYSKADSMLKELEKLNIPCRGHTLFWAVPKNNPDWTHKLNDGQLREAMRSRLKSVLGRYKGKLVHWDVNNEMLHGSFYTDKLRDPNATVWMFQEARKLDPAARLFTNDYDVLRRGVLIDDYVKLIKNLISNGAAVDGVGVQAHFKEENGVDFDVVRSYLDRLAAAGRPIWLTELDVVDKNETNRASKLKVVLKAAFSHPAVEGLLLWGFWSGAMSKGKEAALWDQQWKPTAAGKVWMDAKATWTTQENFSTQTHRQGRDVLVTFRGFYGDYVMSLGSQNMKFTVSRGANRQIQTFSYQINTCGQTHCFVPVG